VEFELRGGLFQSGWTVSLHEGTGIQSSAISDLDGGAHEFPLCLGNSPEEKTLLLGVLPRPETGAEMTRPKRQKKRR
jgi:hypothetical protein